MRKEKQDDKSLIERIQKEYHEYRKTGHFYCSCGIKIPYNLIADNKLVWKAKCPFCSKPVDKFILDNNKEFCSLEYEILYSRYEDKIRRRCEKMRLIEDPTDMEGEMSIRFLISVMTYKWSKNCTFSTYMWGNLRRRFEDFERKNSRACKSNTVQCQCCGRYTGAITRIHLMNIRVRPIDGFPGHGILHKQIVDDIGFERFIKLDDNVEHENNIKWQGTDYSKNQAKFIKSQIVDTYRRMFPNYDLSSHNVSISDHDPNTDLEYSTSIPDKRIMDLSFKGYYIDSQGKSTNEPDKSSVFVPYEIDYRDVDICKYYSNIFASNLHNQFLHDKTRRKFTNTRDKDGLEAFLASVLPLILKGYDKKEIGKLLDLDGAEISFWLKKIKKSNDIKKALNMK